MKSHFIRLLSVFFFLTTLFMACVSILGTDARAIDITNYEVIDLTHPISGKSEAPSDEATLDAAPPDEEEITPPPPPLIFSISSSGQCMGTCVVLPARYSEEGAHADEIPPSTLICNVIVINIRDAVERDPDFVLDAGEIRRWEALSGTEVSAPAVLIETGWDEFWGDSALYYNYDEGGIRHYPGLSLDAVKFLVKERGVKVIGIDAPGIDPGYKGEPEASLFLGSEGGIILLNLTNLKELPPTEAVLFIGLLPLEGWSGAPARIMALIPRR